MTRTNVSIICIIGIELLFLFCTRPASSQPRLVTGSAFISKDRIYDFGFPSIKNYDPKTYKGHAQCWGIAQDLDGRMYFSNTEGILEYDGYSWKLLKLPNGSMSRMVLQGEDSTMYYSGNGVFGFMDQWPDGSTKLISLSDSLPPGSPSFNDVWGLAYWNDRVFFQSSYYVYIWNTLDRTFQIIPAKKEFKRTYMVNSEVWIYSIGEGLIRYDGEKFVKLGTNTEPNARAYGVCNYLDGVLITYDEGLFIYRNGIFQKLKSDMDEVLPELFVLQAHEVDNKEFVVVTANMDSTI